MHESEAFITQLCGTKFQLLAGGKVAHFENDTALRKIALESKRPIHT